MVPLTQSWLWDRIFFRDYPIKNPAEASKYEDLKILLANKYKNDREAYTECKAEYIKEITETAKFIFEKNS
jgi:GrpB-like predicted nucleotidyltransferase (UPF0157 family)